MLEITLIREDGVPFGYQFENDALQTLLAESASAGTGFRFDTLRALGVPLTVTADMPKQQRGKTAKEAAAEADAKVNQPVTRARSTDEQPTARTQQPVKPSTERK